MTQLILIMVCMGFSNNLKLSNLSLLLSGKLPEGTSGNEDGGESWCPCQAGPGVTDGCFPPWVILLSCLFQNRQLSRLCPPLCSREEGKHLGLEERAGWSKG